MNYNELPPELKVMILKKLSTLDLFNLIRKQEAPGDTDVAPIKGSRGSLKDFYKLAKFELFERRGQEACRYQNLMLKAWIKQWSISKNLSFIQNDEDKQAWLKQLTGAIADSSASIEHKLRCCLLVNKLYPNVNANTNEMIKMLEEFYTDYEYMDNFIVPSIASVFFHELTKKNKNDFFYRLLGHSKVYVNNTQEKKQRDDCYKILARLCSEFSSDKIDLLLSELLNMPNSREMTYNLLGSIGLFCDHDLNLKAQILTFLITQYKESHGYTTETLFFRNIIQTVLVKLALAWSNERVMILNFLLQDLQGVTNSLFSFNEFILLASFATYQQKDYIFNSLIDRSYGRRIDTTLAELSHIFNPTQKNIIYNAVINGTNGECDRVRLSAYGNLGRIAKGSTQTQKNKILQLLTDAEFLFACPVLESIADYADICSQEEAGLLLNIIFKWIKVSPDYGQVFYGVRALEKTIPHCNEKDLVSHIDFLIGSIGKSRMAETWLSLCSIILAKASHCTEAQIKQVYSIIVKDHSMTTYKDNRESKSIYFKMLLNLYPYLNNTQRDELKKLTRESEAESSILNYYIATHKHIDDLNSGKCKRLPRVFFKNAQGGINNKLDGIKPSQTYQYQLTKGVIEAINHSNSISIITKSKMPYELNAKMDGKWLIELPAGDSRLDFVWEKILYGVKKDKFHNAKVSGIDETGKFNTQTIIVYTTNYTDYEQLFNIYNVLVSGLKIPAEYIVGYKRDSETPSSSGEEKYWLNLKEPAKSVIFQPENYSKLQAKDKRDIFQCITQLKAKYDNVNLIKFEFFKKELQNTYTNSWKPFRNSEMLNLINTNSIKTIENVMTTISNNEGKFSRSREILRGLEN